MAEVPGVDRKINACLYRHDSLGARAILPLAFSETLRCAVIIYFFCRSFRLPSGEDGTGGPYARAHFVLNLFSLDRGAVRAATECAVHCHAKKSGLSRLVSSCE